MMMRWVVKIALIAHRLVAPTILSPSSSSAGILQMSFSLKADEVFHWLITEFHVFFPLSCVVSALIVAFLQAVYKMYSPFWARPILYAKEILIKTR